ARVETIRTVASSYGPEAEKAFEGKWGVTRQQYFLRGHRPMRRVPDEPETGDPEARGLIEVAARALLDGREEAAEAALNLVDGAHPGLGQASYLRGLLSCARERMGEAATAFETAVRLAP